MSARITSEILWPRYTRHPISLLQLQETSYIPKAASDLLVTSWHCPADRGWCRWCLAGPSELLHLPCPWQYLMPRVMGLTGFSSNTKTFPWGKLPADFFLSPAGKITTILQGPDPFLCMLRSPFCQAGISPEIFSCQNSHVLHSLSLRLNRAFFQGGDWHSAAGCPHRESCGILVVPPQGGGGSPW